MDKYQQKLEAELKQLERQLADTTQIMNDLHEQNRVLQRKVNAARSRLESFKFNPKALVISDHVILRYAERNHGFGFEEVRQEIYELMKGAESIGSLKFRGFIVRGHTVVTYIHPDEEKGQA